LTKESQDATITFEKEVATLTVALRWQQSCHDMTEEATMDLGLLILRVVVGLTLAAHGSQKLFGWFGGHGLAGTGSFLEQLGFRPGKLQAFLSGSAEAGGGLLLAAGLFTPLAAAAVVAVMFVAIVSVGLAKGFFAQNGGFEYPMVLATIATAVAFAGPGSLSLDRALGIPWQGPSWGLAALGAGLLMGAAPLLARKKASAARAQQAA
jgi:putative oxidoreductase